MHFYERHYREAAAAYEKALEINDNDYRVWGALASAYRWMQADESKVLRTSRRAADLAEEWLQVNPTDLEVKAELAVYYAELGENDKARALRDEFGVEPDAELPSHISFLIGAALEELGERRAALLWLEDALAKGYAINEIAAYPGFSELQADPAFVRIMASYDADSTTTE
jgi:tetratricopeptide (TPR) repeat protein